VRMGAFVKHLAAYYEVTLISMAGSGHHVDPLVAERFRDRDNRLGVTERVRIPFSQPGYFLFSPTFYRKADRLLRFGSFDYLLADYGLAATYGALFARRYRTPLIYSSHNVEYRLYLNRSLSDLRRVLLIPYVYLAERSACRAAKLVVAISEDDREAFLKWASAESIAVIPQGFDPEIYNPFYPPPPDSPSVVLFVGNFGSDHNRQAARHIVKEIVGPVTSKRKDVKFQLVGANPPTGLEGPGIECPGFVDNLVPYLRRANLIIAPMRFEQGMSTKIITGLALGKTVLTTPEGAGAIPRKYKQMVVSSLDVFPSKIVELLARTHSKDDADFATLCKDFGWPSVTAALHRRIEECCAPSTGNPR